jgi:hypothetical protein
MGKSANTQKTDSTKRKPPKTAWKPGQSGNPAGAPKRGESWQEIIKRVGEMTPKEASERSKVLAAQLLSIGEGVTLKEAVVMRVYGALLFDPNPGLLNSFMDRAEGKVKQAVEMSWQEEAKRDGVDPDKLKADLTAQFVAAMVGQGDGGSVPGSETDSEGTAPGAEDG